MLLAAWWGHCIVANIARLSLVIVRTFQLFNYLWQLHIARYVMWAIALHVCMFIRLSNTFILGSFLLSNSRLHTTCPEAH